MIKESKHPIARALFVDKSDLAEREKEDLEFVDKLLSRESKLFASRYEILSVITSNSHENDENVNVNNLNNNKSRLTKSHRHHNHNPYHHHRHNNNHLNVNKSHKSKHQNLHHPYQHHHHHHHHHHPVVNNIGNDSTHLVNDAPGTVTASYLAFILWQILLRSKRSWPTENEH